MVEGAPEWDASSVEASEQNEGQEEMLFTEFDAAQAQIDHNRDQLSTLHGQIDQHGEPVAGMRENVHRLEGQLTAIEGALDATGDLGVDRAFDRLAKMEESITSLQSNFKSVLDSQEAVADEGSEEFDELIDDLANNDIDLGYESNGDDYVDVDEDNDATTFKDADGTIYTDSDQDGVPDKIEYADGRVAFTGGAERRDSDSTGEHGDEVMFMEEADFTDNAPDRVGDRLITRDDMSSVQSTSEFATRDGVELQDWNPEMGDGVADASVADVIGPETESDQTAGEDILGDFDQRFEDSVRDNASLSAETGHDTPVIGTDQDGEQES